MLKWGLQMENPAFCDCREKGKGREGREGWGRTAVPQSVRTSWILVPLLPGILCLSKNRGLYPFLSGSHVVLQGSAARRGNLIDFQRVNTKHEQAQGVLVGRGAGRAAAAECPRPGRCLHSRRGCTSVFAFAQGAFLVVFMGDWGQMKGPYVLWRKELSMRWCCLEGL